MYQQTSLFAWQDVKQELGERQRVVLECIRNFPKIDNLMIAETLRLPINSVTPRVHELRRLGRVREAGMHKSGLTGRTVMGWEVSE